LLKNESNIIKKFFRFLNYKLSYYIEYKNFNKLNSIHFVSKDDAKYYNNFKLNNIINIPVALPDFYFSRNIELDNSKTIVLIGDIRVNYIYEGIYLFFKNNYPEVQKNFSQIKFIVVSKSIPFGKLKDLTINNKNISFLPWVDDLYDLCCKSTAIVLNDLNGTGQKNRTIMSLASGRPVLGTNFAFQGIEINNAEHGYIYKIDNELNVSLMKVLNDPILADKIGIAGKKYAYTNFSMHSVSKQWLSLYSNIAKREVYAVSRSL
ncbi:MAG: glycosyltransferase, partial [Acinetobacter sp.]